MNAYGTVSADGRYLSFTDWSGSGNLAIRDLTTGTDRHLTGSGSAFPAEDFADRSAVSPDGSQVAFAWYVGKDDRFELRVIATDTRTPTTRTLVANPEFDFVQPFGWSPDGTWIAVSIRRADRTAQIGLVSSADGTIRVLKSVDWRGANRDGHLAGRPHVGLRPPC